ncbi:VaFE repeat-containing surface-anchored protein [Collinsella aerofaciens]|uniref:VaFE repeat-containing surface-anchored protein n=1 Tax=Collinsella aerofaciens TaxID=74426 RepID=UPI00232F7660|nr:VaFE repeat-containing surface-anchored protein [Collinsella aerofaciens]MDB1894657.1 VaFE repeat-containing surface-anchored protein [Collinsella aerofaciens]MDB1898476.1 VaFE repeat-containing surface-anchored protein [Collinsella aerofaciens]
MRPGGKMKECAGRLFRRIGARLKKGAAIGTGAVLIASQVLSIVPAPTAAYAAASETITRGERVNYGGFYMYNSTTSEGTPAICLDPGKRHPLDASTAQAQLPIESDWSKCYTGGGGEQTKIDRLDGMARVLYYGPTGPGFEEAKAKGLWSFNWYDGTPLDYSKMLAIQHIALSALSKSSSQYGMQGTTAGFRNWCYKTILYYNGNINAGTFLANLDKNLPGPAPKSFKDTIYLVNYGTGTQCLITFHNKGKLKLKKASSNPGISDNNPCYSLEGATYGVYSDSVCTQQVGTLTCNASGDSNVIDIAPGTYYVKETQAGKSYALDEGIHQVNVSGGQTATVNVTDTPQNDPADMLVAKVDSETGKASPLGAGTLAGAEFTVKYYDGFYTQENLPEKATRTWVLKTDENGRTSLARVTLDKDKYFVSGDSFYTSTNGNITLPIGTVTVQETKAPSGYLLSDNSIHIQQITSNTMTERVTTFVEPSEDAPTVREQVKRGDIAFNKVHGEDMTGLAGVPFKITSTTTGESHIAITDVNGILTTEASACPHTQNTNGNDAALHAEGTVDESKLSIDNGLWFSGSKDAQTAADDSKGALPYDTYTFEELRCTTNTSLNLVKFEVTVSRDAYTIDRGTVDDNPIEIGTTATDGADGDHKLLASNQAEIVDSVSYKGLKKGTEYELQGTLMDAETGEALKGMDGKEITATAKFTPKASSGKQKVKFKFDATLLGGHKAVVFERLYLDGKIQASHEDPEDEDQTIEFLPVEIGTTATDAADGDKSIGVGKAVTVEDEVSYKNLATGREYTVTGTLMDSATGEPIKDAEGNTVTASTTFEPEDTVGKVKVTFSVDTSTLSNKKLVVFEKLEADGNVIASHEDLTDEGQTVEVIPPEIKTSAADGADGDKEVTADGKATIVDTVKYTGLVPGTEYELQGTLMDAETGEALRGVDGKEITASAKFTPQAQDGTKDVTFTFDASALGGAKTVVFEKLFVDGTLIGSHEDPTDKDQTVEISPSLKTTAATIQGSKVVKPEDEAAIVDTVHLKGLRPGQSYTLTASINKKADGTQLTLTDVKDASTLAGNGIQKGFDTDASGTDLSKALVDVTGTGSFVNIPEGAKLTKNDDGTYTLTVPGATQDAADIVTKLSGGQVKLVSSDKSNKTEGDNTATETESTGRGSMLGTYEVIANGQVRFTPTVSDLDVDVPMVFKASDVAGQQAVVFESLQRDTDGREISKETDLEDTDQTIDIENNPEGKNLEQTGNWVLYVAIAAGVAACIAGIVLVCCKRKI